MNDEQQPLIDPDCPQSQPNPSSVPTTSTTTSLKSHTVNHRAQDVRIWLPSQNAQPAPRQALPQSFFEPTASEAQKAFAGQVSQREKLTDAPLLTKSLREREVSQKKKEKLNRFPTTRVRIRFADQTMLEGTFSSTCKISDVYQFVRESLLEQHRNESLILYQTPPRREFLLEDPKLSSSDFLDLQLAPSSLFLIKFSQEILNNSSNPPPLLLELLNAAQPLPSIPSFEDESSNTLEGKIEKGKQKLDSLLKSGAKVPKWLQQKKK